MPTLSANTASALEQNRERQRQLEGRSAGRDDGLPAKDRRELDALVREERTLVRRERLAAEASGEGQSWIVKTWTKIEAVFRPLKLIGGLFLVLVAILVVVSMLLTGIDKAKNSICKSHCGYILGHINIFNPLNWILVESSKIFPIDYVLFLLLVLFFFSSSVVGIATVGIRFLWLKLFQIRQGHTSPQALIMATVLLTLSALAINFSIAMFVAPQYTHYGPQTFCDRPLRYPTDQPDCSTHHSKIRPCSEVETSQAALNVCTPSVVSTFLDSITVNFSFFGVVCFWAQFVFLGTYNCPSSQALFFSARIPTVFQNLYSLQTFTISSVNADLLIFLKHTAVYLVVFVTTLFRTPKLDEYALDQDAEEEEEEGLLASTGRRFGATWQDITGRAKNGSATGNGSRDERGGGNEEN